jgi:hypothetical protein
MKTHGGQYKENQAGIKAVQEADDSKRQVSKHNWMDGK